MDLKHVCKFCKKSFPCGRSLGGHIRSHLIRNNNNNSTNAPNEESEYELRENPRKTDKVANLLNSSPSTWSIGSETEPDKGDHKQNTTKRSNTIGGNNSHSSVSEVSETEQEEIAIAMCLIMLSRDVRIKGGISSSIDDEFSDQILLLQANNTKRRSKREKIQGKSSVSAGMNNANNTNKKSKNLEISPSGFVQNGSKIKEVEIYANGFALNDQGNKPFETKNSVSETSNFSGKSKKVEALAHRQVQNGLKMKELEVSRDGFTSIDQNNKPSNSKRKMGDAKNVSKMKEIEVSDDGFTLNDQKSNTHESNLGEIAMNSELLYNNCDNKRSKFECTTCNKVFNSYQALGGHRASHKKLLEVKSSPVSELENLHPPMSNPPPNDHAQQQQLVAEIGIGSSSSSPPSSKKHECPICFRVFPSGQALGGHKRSHLLATTGNNVSNGISLIEKSSPQTRDLLDLNLPPATVEDEITTTNPTTSSSNSVVDLIKPYWWVKSSNHEPTLGLISN